MKPSKLVAMYMWFGNFYSVVGVHGVHLFSNVTRLIRMFYSFDNQVREHQTCPFGVVNVSFVNEALSFPLHERAECKPQLKLGLFVLKEEL